MDPETYIPFCGLPPEPAELLTRWLLDPALLGGLLVAFVVGMALAQNRWRFGWGWALVAVLFVSPLCALSMALFSARVAQHLVLTLVAAPLLAAALPRLRVSPTGPALAFAGLFWLWHAPGPYAATLQSDPVYWAMHLSLLGAAIALWSSLAATVQRAPFAAFLVLAATAAQMTLYAVLVVLSPSLWHGWHLTSAPPWGVDAMADQALAGALMWVGGGLLMSGAVTLLVTRRLLSGTQAQADALRLQTDPEDAPQETPT